MTLNEEVARALGWTDVGMLPPTPIDGWTRLAGTPPSGPTDSPVVDGWGGEDVPDFDHDWNAIYRWIVPAVKEMKGYDHFLFVDFVQDELLTRDAHSGPETWPLDAFPEDYCRAFLKVKEA